MFRFFFADVTQEADLFFAMDTTVNEDSIRQMRNFILDTLPAFNLSRLGVRVAILPYSGTARFALKFKQGITKTAIENALKSIAPSNDGRLVSNALLKSITEFRWGVPRNVIVFVNGPVTGRLTYLRRVILYINRHGMDAVFLAKGNVNKDFINAVSTSKSIVKILQPGENPNRYLHLVIPSATKSGNKQY